MPDILNKSLWRAYIFILAVSGLIMAAGVYFIWQTIKNEIKNELTFTNKIVSSSMRSLLQKDEALFKITSERLLEIGLFSKPQESQKVINDLLNNNPEFAGIGLVDPQGQVIISTSNITTKNLPNLLEKKETSDSFKKSLELSELVMGHTYFLKELKQWIVPVRFRIVDKTGKVVAVLAAGLKLKGKFSPWQSESLPEGLKLSIVSSDFYYQFASLVNEKEVKEKYNRPLSKEYLKVFSKYLMEQAGLTINDFLNDKEEIVTLIYPSPEGGTSIAAFSYDSKYKLFTFTFNKLPTLYIKLLAPIGWLLVLLFLFDVVLYFMFKYYSKLQNQAKKDLEYQAQHDHLTGLPNLRFLSNHFSRWQKQNGNSFSVLFIDLDDFKNSNDLHGHAIGDKILCEVASRICLFFTECLWIRQGGDEFIILVPLKFSQNIEQSCKKFLQNLKQAIAINKLVFSIRASIGVATSPSDGVEINSLLRKADIAMYEAKRNKTGVYVFSRKLDIHNSRVSMIGKELNSALERNEMSMVYQPQFEAFTNNIVGVEALLRWNNKTLGQVPPDEFIPIAETTGLIIELGKFVFETALSEFYQVCKKFSENPMFSDVNKQLRLSINLSIRQIADAGFIDMLFELINQYDCKNTKLMLEITETMTIDRIEEISFTLEKIQLAGIDISLDDFGTGYSSLSYLSKLPINELKIDKSFIQGIPQTQQDVSLIKSIINLGKSLNVRVLAEGVETKEQLEVLTHNGCKYFQGFYFSYPLSREELFNFLQKTIK